MSYLSVFLNLSPSSKQKVTWFVLFALLFIQVRVAVGGCLVSGYLPIQQPAEQAMQMKSAGDPCAGHGSPDKQSCMMHCEQSSDTLKYTFDLPLFAPAVLPTSVPSFTAANVASIVTPTLVLAASGPPPYLRFLRLLN
ncbi:MAG: hypothetical protein KGQ44_00575 [Betaproteobacteria bacterium]|nr:hypothetical protein [Betaproteobacteria bacterium]